MKSLVFAINWLKKYFAPTEELDLLRQYLRIRTESIGVCASSDKEKEVFEKVANKLIVQQSINHKRPGNQEDFNSKEVIQIFLKFFHLSLKKLQEKKSLLREQDKLLFQPALFDYNSEIMSELRKEAKKINEDNTLGISLKEKKYTEVIHSFLNTIPHAYEAEYETIKKLFTIASLFLISPHSKATPFKLVIEMPVLVLAIGITSEETLIEEQLIWKNIGATLLNYFYRSHEVCELINKFSNSKDKNLKSLFVLDQLEGSINAISKSVQVLVNQQCIAEKNKTKLDLNILRSVLARMLGSLLVFENHGEENLSLGKSSVPSTIQKESVTKMREEKFKNGFNKSYASYVDEELEKSFLELWKCLIDFKASMLQDLEKAPMVRQRSKTNLRISIIGDKVEGPQTKETDINQLLKKFLEDCQNTISKVSSLITAKQQEILETAIRTGIIKDDVQLKKNKVPNSSTNQSEKGIESTSQFLAPEEDEEMSAIFDYWHKQSQERSTGEETRTEDKLESKETINSENSMLFQYPKIRTPDSQTCLTPALEASELKNENMSLSSNM